MRSHDNGSMHKQNRLPGCCHESTTSRITEHGQASQVRHKSTATVDSREKGLASKRSPSSSEPQFTKKERQSALVHPLFAKEKEKIPEETLKGTKPPLSQAQAKRTSKPITKSEQQAGKLPQMQAAKLARQSEASKNPGGRRTASPAESLQPAKKGPKAVQLAPAKDSATTSSQAPDALGQTRKGGKGPKQQVAFAPQPTKLRMAPVSPDAIADPYRYQ